MRESLIRKVIGAGFLLLFSSGGFSQSYHLSLRDVSGEFFAGIEKEQLRVLDSLYMAEAGYDNNFINGRDHVPYYSRSKNNPILDTDKDHTASLVYHGRLYKNLFLQYDTYLDRVIYCITSAGSGAILRQVELNSFNISSFFLCYGDDTLTFRYLSRESDTTFNLENGFYEMVYDGMCKYLLRHKSTKYKLHGVDEYACKSPGYVRVGDGFARITSRKRFVSLFCDKPKEIDRFMTENRINLRRADKHQITAIMQFYESISAGCR